MIVLRRYNDFFGYAVPWYSIFVGVATAAVFDSVFRGTWRTWNSGGTREFGFAFWGWAIGVMCFSAAWGKVFQIGAKRMLDFFAPSLAIAQGFGRIGCFLGGCCYGCPSDKMGLHYPPGSLPYEKVGDIALFPVQLVESLMLFLLFGLCIKSKRSMRCGIYLLGASLNRCVLEYFRYDNRGMIFGQNFFSPSQIVSIILFCIGIVMFLYSNKKEC